MKTLLRPIFLGLLFLTAACGGQQPASTDNTGSVQSSSTGSTFSVEVTGSMNATLASGAATSSFTEEAYTEDFGSYVLWFGDGAGLAVSLIFYSKEAPQPGTYDITNASQENTVSALVINNRDTLQSFALSQGSITLESAGESVSGSFTFNSQGGANGAIDQTVTVNGTFSEVQ